VAGFHSRTVPSVSPVAVDEQFQKLSRLVPGDEESTDSWFERFRPGFLKESLAALRGADDVVQVIAHNLSSPYQFFRAAEMLAAADRMDEALDWLSRGRAAFGDDDARLADLGADLHHQAGRHVPAADLAWQRFTAHPSLGTYQRLHEFATAAGDWPQRREAALELLRAQPTAGEARPGPAWAQPPGHSLLVEVLRWEGDPDAAWQAAKHGGCTRRHWLQVAGACAGQHPADAIPIFQKEILNAVQGAKRSAYHAAAELAKELCGYAERRPVRRIRRVDTQGPHRQRPARGVAGRIRPSTPARMLKARIGMLSIQIRLLRINPGLAAAGGDVG
jgi:uncharacterized Zn finger protein